MLSWKKLQLSSNLCKWMSPMSPSIPRCVPYHSIVLLQLVTCCMSHLKWFSNLNSHSFKILKGQVCKYCRIMTFEHLVLNVKMKDVNKSQSTAHQSRRKVSQKPKTVTTGILYSEEKSRLHSYYRKIAVNYKLMFCS